MWLAEYLLMDRSSVASLCGLGMKVHQKSDHNVCRRVLRKGTSLKGVSVATIVGNFCGDQTRVYRVKEWQQRRHVLWVENADNGDGDDDRAEGGPKNNKTWMHFHAAALLLSPLSLMNVCPDRILLMHYSLGTRWKSFASSSPGSLWCSFLLIIIPFVTCSSI